MAVHPGELDPKYHPYGIARSWETAYVKKFPLTEEQAEVVRKRGGIVQDLYFGQEVYYSGGGLTVHGTKGGDGLHTAEDPVFE